MAAQDSEYIVAPKREFRESADPEWMKKLQGVDGVEIVGGSSMRAQVKIDPQAVDKVRQLLGDSFYIEPVVHHRPIRA